MDAEGNNENHFQQERDRLHLQMMSAVSHDLKTPLASIIGSLEIHNKMSNVLTSEKKAALLETAVEEAYRLDGFISNILDMARLDNGMIKVYKQHHDIHSIVQECISKFLNRTPKAIINLKPLQADIYWDTDSSLLNRALYCLLENAAKHGNKEPVINVEIETIGQAIQINVRDNGAGVSEDEVDKIFDKYTRISKKDYKNAGTGLGLTICRAIVELLGGKVSIKLHDKSQHTGAWFIVSIPQS